MTRLKTRLIQRLEKVPGLMAMGLAVLISATAIAAAATDQDKPEHIPGDIIVAAAGADGEALAGVLVRLILPGPDGSLDKAPNLLFESTDGGKYDADGARNGAVVFSVDDIGDYADDGIHVLIEVSLKDYVPLKDLKKSYQKNEINSFTIEMQKQNSGKQ